MIAPTRDLRSLSVGEQMAVTTKALSTGDLMAYGAATWDWHILHYDLGYAKSVGLPNVILDGQAFGALFARHAIDWLGPRAFIMSLKFRIRSMAFAGDVLTTEGEVASTQHGDGSSVAVLSQRIKIGERLVSEATTSARLPST